MKRDWDCIVPDGDLIVDFTNAYSPGYVAILEEIERTRTCPFSQAGLAQASKEIIAEAGGWFMIEATPRYLDRESNPLPAHLLFVSKIHGLWVPSPEDFHSVGMLTMIAREMYPSVEGWGFSGRLSNHGKSEFGGQSICHNHFHLFAPNTREDPRTPTGLHGVALDFGFF